MTKQRDDLERHDLERDALDRKLKALPAPEPSAALRRAVAEIPLRHPQASAPLVWFPAFAWRSALVASVLVFAAGALSGFYGTSLLPEVAQLDEVTEDESAEPWQELTALAFASELDEELAP